MSGRPICYGVHHGKPSAVLDCDFCEHESGCALTVKAGKQPVASQDEWMKRLREKGWVVWHLGQRSFGWEAVLYSDEMQRGVENQKCRRMGGYTGGFSHKGVGPTIAHALADAARDVFSVAAAEEEL